MLRFSVIAVMLLLVAFPVRAENVYVDPNNPEGFATITEAVEEASAGDVIFVAEGTYLENVSIAENVWLIGAGPELTTIYALTGDAITIGADCDTTTVIEGVTIRSEKAEGIDMSSGGSATIRNCVITNCGNYCIYGKRCAALIRGNQIVGNSQGLYMENDAGSIITNNIIKNNAGYNGGIYFYGDASATVFANNLVKASELYGIYCLDASPMIKNNVIVENGNAGIYLSSGEPLIASNIIVDNEYGISGYGSPAVIYNDVFSNTSENYSEGVSSDIGDISKDPKFVDTKDDYHLQEGSPCIDAGITGAAYLDLDGSRNDMGMYGGPFARFWEEPYTGPIVTSIEVTPTRVQQGGTITVRATGTTVRE